jgi:hypothetical protein
LAAAGRQGPSHPDSQRIAGGDRLGQGEERTVNKVKLWLLLLTSGVILPLAACAPPSAPEKTVSPTPAATSTPASLPLLPTPTATPTQQVPLLQDTPTPSAQGLCHGLGAEIEVRLDVPYAAAAELNPVAVGYIPLSVHTEREPYAVEGKGHISYDETKTWTDEEGKETAEVFLELDVHLDGTCVEDASGGELDLVLDAVHQEEQGAEICAYPPGECEHSPVMGPHEQSFELEVPLVDGATVQREDWTSWSFIVHLHGG